MTDFDTAPAEAAMSKAEARLAAALDRLDEQWREDGDPLAPWWEQNNPEMARLILAADPTLICPDPEAHGLADAVREWLIPLLQSDASDRNRHPMWRNGILHAITLVERAALEAKTDD